ncbi:MAG: phosphoribosylformylglycinamidine cyclo-ligase [Dehalococcoidales bacterium]|nr:phosphoribosylformylglycinamidine cyclo-ligase [Dehalococcoidales bacterium]
MKISPAKMTYAASGVDRDGHSEITLALRSQLKMKDPRILNKVGAFASLFEASFPGIQDPVLVLKAEEPGSKQLLAKQFNKIDNIGFDMINHLINDIIVMGAKPFAVLDVIIVGKLIKEDVTKIITAINQACENQDCSLVGGETSEQPGVLPEGQFVLSSSVVGVVSKQKIIDGSRIKNGDTVIAIASNGLHTNGYSLVRKLIAAKPAVLKKKINSEVFIDAVLKPHTAYYPGLKDILTSPKVRGLAHITGDGISGNLERILPTGLSALVHLEKIEVLPLFKVIKKAGGVPEEDMLNNLNLGVGMIMVTAPKEEASMIKYLETKGLHAYDIGEIIPDADNTVKFDGKLAWE